MNRSLDEITLGQISDALTFEANGMTHLLGGITFDSAKRISGRHSKGFGQGIRLSAWLVLDDFTPKLFSRR